MAAIGALAAEQKPMLVCVNKDFPGKTLLVLNSH
jgi:hypothetical protein